MKKLIALCFLFIAFAFCSCEKPNGSCSDRIKNQNEDGVDCGGNCPHCATCTDGRKNQDETGIDCGGALCNVCPTCDDGIKNQDETGVDCGGTCESCTTTACNTPLGFGENGYLPSNTATLIAGNADTVNILSEYKLQVNASFPLFYPCNGYVISFYEKSFLKMTNNTTEVFTTNDSNYSPSNLANKCYVEVFMPQAYLPAKAQQKVYVTKINATTFNIKFCELNVYNVSPYTLNTVFSANTNFTI